MLIVSSAAWFLPVLIALACPLMMIMMMRGMHGGGPHGGHGTGQQGKQRPPDEMTLDELKAQRDALTEEISQRAEQHTLTHY